MYGRYGYRRITALLRNEGWPVNRKRVERIWRQEGFTCPLSFTVHNPEMHEVTLSRGIPALIQWLPSDVSDANPPRELLHAVKRYENVHLLEGNKVVSDMSIKQIIRHGHPAKEAHRRYGEQIAKKLREMGIEGVEVEINR